MSTATMKNEEKKERVVPRLTWIAYRVELIGSTELLGGMPKTQELIAGQMASKEMRLKARALGRDVESIIAENMAAMGIEENDNTELDEDKMSCGFRKNTCGYLCLGAHQIPSMLIDCATTLKLSRSVSGLKDTLTRGTQVFQPSLTLIPILDDRGEAVKEPTETLEWGSQIQDQKGKRAILRRYDYVFPWRLSFSIRYPGTGIITQTIWEDLWAMAEVQGLGAARPRGYGRFSVGAMERIS